MVKYMLVKLKTLTEGVINISLEMVQKLLKNFHRHVSKRKRLSQDSSRMMLNKIILTTILLNMDTIK